MHSHDSKKRPAFDKKSSNKIIKILHFVIHKKNKLLLEGSKFWPINYCVSFANILTYYFALLYDFFCSFLISKLHYGNIVNSNEMQEFSFEIPISALSWFVSITVTDGHLSMKSRRWNSTYLFGFLLQINKLFFVNLKVSISPTFYAKPLRL